MIDSSTTVYLRDDEVVTEEGGDLWIRLNCEALVRRSANRWRPCRRTPEFTRLGRKVCFVHMRTDEVTFPK